VLVFFRPGGTVTGLCGPSRVCLAETHEGHGARKPRAPAGSKACPTTLNRYPFAERTSSDFPKRWLAVDGPLGERTLPTAVQIPCAGPLGPGRGSVTLTLSRCFGSRTSDLLSPRRSLWRSQGRISVFGPSDFRRAPPAGCTFLIAFNHV
jgi:hypothetical protein